MSAGTDGGAGGDEKSFLGRWSRRKRGEEAPGEARADAPAIPRGEPDGAGRDPASGTAASPEGAGGASGGGVEARAPDALVAPGAVPDEPGRDLSDTAAANEPPLLSDADMPALETLSADSDLSPFFNRGVTAALRRAALRHVFHQPRYNLRDGLNDYDGDYTVFEPLGDTVTSDMKFHAARRERERLERERETMEHELAARDAAQSERSGHGAAEDEAERDVVEREADAGDADGEEAAGKGLVARRAGDDAERSEPTDLPAAAEPEGDAGWENAARSGDEATGGGGVQERESADADGRTRRSSGGERPSERREEGATRG